MMEGTGNDTRFKKGQSGNPATQFKPGHVGNPKGRLPRPTQEMYSRLLAMDVSKIPSLEIRALAEKHGAKTVAEALGWAQLMQAIQGNTIAHKEVFDRLEGKAVQAVDFTDNTPTERLTPEEAARRIVFALNAAASEKEKE